MTDDTTPETVQEQPVEMTEDAALGAIWDRHHSEAPPADAPATEEHGPARGPDGKFVSTKPEEAPAPEQPEEDAEAPAEEDADKPAEEEKAEDAPGSLPRAIRDAWKTLTPEVREAFKASQDKMARELGQATRERQAIRPIYDVVVKAAQELPQMRDMTPAQIAEEVFSLARVGTALQSQPVETILKLAQDFGAVEGLKARLGGEQGNDTISELQQTVAQLRKELTTLRDPRALESTISQRLNEERTLSEVETFARSKADWSEVEPHMARFVETAREMTPDAAPRDILEAAYDMAVHAIPALRQRHIAAQRQTRGAEAARSINVRAAPTKPAVLTDDQAMEAVWAKHYG